MTTRQLIQDSKWWEIYQDSFPLVEREPPQVILKGLESGVGTAIRAVDETTGKTVGIQTQHQLKSLPYSFMVYLATDPALRGNKIGRQLFEFGQNPSPRQLGLVWEVEIPDLATSVEDRLLRHRRIGFFQKLGGVILPGVYVQPPLQNGIEVPMHLMMKNYPGSPKFNSHQIPDLISAIHLEKYRNINGINWHQST